MMKQTTCYGCDKPIEPEWLPEGEFIVCDECSSDTDELSAEKLQEELESCIQTLIEASVAANITQDIVVGNLVDRKLADLAKTHKLAVDYIEKVTGKNIDAAKKYIEESYKADKEDNKLLDLIIEAVAKLKSDNKTLKKYIEHVIGTIKHDGHLGTIQTDWVLPDLEKALAEIGGNDE